MCVPQKQLLAGKVTKCVPTVAGIDLQTQEVKLYLPHKNTSQLLVPFIFQRFRVRTQLHKQEEKNTNVSEAVWTNRSSSAGRASLLMPPWLCSQSKEHFHFSRTAYQRAHPTLSPAGLMVLAILSTLIFVLHSHHRDKWFDRCTGTAWGILMDTVFIRGFVSSRCKHTLCTSWFPSVQIRPNTRSWWFTSESNPSSSANWTLLSDWGAFSVKSTR